MTEAVRTHRDQDESTRHAPARSEEQTCPECDGPLVADGEHGETICEECGLVVDEGEIDPGPE